jgi:hypothetical protein
MLTAYVVGRRENAQIYTVEMAQKDEQRQVA